jgi:hypothetical protein
MKHIRTQVHKRESNVTRYPSINNILARFGLSDYRPASIALDPGTRLDASLAPSTPAEVAFMRTVDYVSAVGALMYLAIVTRPDIAYAVGVLYHLMVNPCPEHWKAAEHLLRYVAGTIDFCLLYRLDPNIPNLFRTFSDADLAGIVDTGRSTTGYVVKMDTGAVSWSSKLQSIVALSTTEAEFVSAVSSGPLGNRRKGLGEVDAGTLREALCNKTGLVALDQAIDVALDLENSFGPNCLLAGRELNKLPSAVVQVRLHLIGSAFVQLVGMWATHGLPERLELGSVRDVSTGALVTMDFGFRFRDHVLSYTVYKPGGMTETSHRCLSSYHNLQVSRLCYITVACPLTTTSRASPFHRLEPRVCCCAGRSGLELTAITNPDDFVVFRTPSASFDVVSTLVVIASRSSIERCTSCADRITRCRALCRGAEANTAYVM